MSEEPHKDSEPRYQAIFEQAAVGVAQIETATGRFVHINQHFCSLLGYTREEMLQKTFHDVTHPDDRLMDLENRRRILGGEIRQFTREKRYMRKDGGIIWIRLTVSAMWAPGETPMFNSAVVEDITERILAEQRLRQSEDKWRRLIDILPVGVTILDANRRVVDMNPAIEGILSVTHQDMLAGTYAKRTYIHPDGSPMKPEEFPSQRALKENTVVEHTEIGVMKEDGQVVWLDVSAAALPFSDAACAVVSVDITQRKLAEESMRRSQKMEALGQLTGGIAHDFNNQLGIILGNLELLEAADLDPSLRPRAAGIRAAGERAAKLTRSLLGFARGQPAQKSSVDLRSHIASFESLISRSLTPGITVLYDFAADLWPASIDAGDFQDALINLLLNARDAMPSGGSVLIKLTNSFLDGDYSARNPGVEPGDYVQLDITDTGHGMPREVLARIFEPFFTTKSLASGTGLGLAMVFGFARRSGGHVNAYSEPGVGTTIRIYMPRAAAGIAAAGGDLETQPLPRGTETLLIVDDEKGLLDVARSILGSLGYKVHAATTAAEALNVLAHEPDISLLFTDVVMPGGLDGYQLATEARKRHRNLKVLITSGYAGHTLRGSESLPILAKPYKMSDLAETVRALLDNSQPTG